MRKYIGGFANTGKGSFEGDDKDKAMREIADSFIGEAVREKSSTVFSYTTIFNKLKGGSPNISFYDLEKNTYCVLIAGKPSVCMLARNVDFRNKPLYNITKIRITFLHKLGSTFVVGDCPKVDSYFIDYLDEIKAEYTIYHCLEKSRI